MRQLNASPQVGFDLEVAPVLAAFATLCVVAAVEHAPGIFIV